MACASGSRRPTLGTAQRWLRWNRAKQRLRARGVKACAVVVRRLQRRPATGQRLGADADACLRAGAGEFHRVVQQHGQQLAQQRSIGVQPGAGRCGQLPRQVAARWPLFSQLVEYSQYLNAIPNCVAH